MSDPGNELDVTAGLPPTGPFSNIMVQGVRAESQAQPLSSSWAVAALLCLAITEGRVQRSSSLRCLSHS